MRRSRLRELLVLLAVVSCARTDTAEKRPTRPTTQRTLILVDGAPTTDPALRVPAPAAAALSRHVRARLASNRTLVLVPDDEVTAIRLRAEACKASARSAECRAEIEKGTAPDLIVQLVIARHDTKACSLSVESAARRADTPSPIAPGQQDSACVLASLQEAADALLGSSTTSSAAPPLCENRCDAGELTCKERAKLSCIDGDWDGCVEWVAEPCGGSEACSRGACIADRPDMAFIPEGPFRMGSGPDELARAMAHCRARKYDCLTSWWKTEQPAHWVSVSGFFLDKTEVTNAQYEACVKAGACRMPDTKSCRVWDEKLGDWRKGAALEATYAGADKPVVCVTHDEARAYCKWTKKRLPTEAEWEKAARSTDGRLYPWGNDRVDGSRTNGCDKRCASIAGRGWRAERDVDDGNTLVAAAGTFPAGASPYGVLDMSGNVWEWVHDRYSEEYYGVSERQDPKGPTSGDARVVRGGSWSNEPDSLRAAYRYSLVPDTRMTTLGFRCAAP